MNNIHQTSIISENCEIGNDVEIGPYCVIGSGVKIGSKCKFISHVVILDYTIIGDNNTFYPFVVIGGSPQDKKYKGEKTNVIIGNNNIFREGVTVHKGTSYGRGKTEIKNDNLFMVSSHIAHDCIINDNVILTNGSCLAGHITIGEGVFIGGMAGLKQYIEIGRFTMISAGSMVEQDVPPFCIAAGNRAKPKGINVVGLKRNGFNKETIQELTSVYKKLYISKLSIKSSIKQIDENNLSDYGREFLSFIKKRSF